MQTNRTFGATAAHPTTLITSGTWMPVFAVSALPLFLFQPSAFVTLSMAATVSLTMMMFAHLSVLNDRLFDPMHTAVKFLAPVQFALLIWLAVHAGHQLAGSSYAASCLVAFIWLAFLLVADAVVSAVLLHAAGRGRGTAGVSLVSLISAKYAGLLGKIS